MQSHLNIVGVTMNTYTLNFELVALEYDASVLQLLRLPCMPVAQIQKIKAVYWQNGGKRSFTADSADKIISKLSNTSFNELEVHLKLADNSQNVNNLFESNRCHILFDISPSCSLWNTVSNDSYADNEAERNRISFQSYEVSLNMRAIKRPSYCSFNIPTNCTSNPDDFLKSVIPSIIQMFVNSNITCTFLGGIECRTSGGQCAKYFTNLLPHLLSRWPYAYPMIGDKMDKVRPITIAPEILCEKIRCDLELPKESLYDLPNTGSQPMALLQIPLFYWDNPTTITRLNRFAVPRNETTIYNRPANLEVRENTDCSDHSCWSYLKYTSLMDQNVLPPLPDECVFLFFVPIKYCYLININPGDMLVHPVQKEFADLYSITFEEIYQAIIPWKNTQDKTAIILEVLEKISFHFPALQEKLLYTSNIVRRQ